MRDTIKIMLTPDEFIALARVAERECRPVPMQARHLVLEALRRDGYTSKSKSRNEQTVSYASR
jgi:hypothetical protein